MANFSSSMKVLNQNNFTIWVVKMVAVISLSVLQVKNLVQAQIMVNGNAVTIIILSHFVQLVEHFFKPLLSKTHVTTNLNQAVSHLVVSLLTTQHIQLSQSKIMDHTADVLLLMSVEQDTHPVIKLL